MVGRYRIPQHRQDTRAVDIFDGCRLGLHFIKERRQANIG
ncbi:Uncharacterised protein [Salmonella enterica subsp. enterica serovar Bovismorbificans]|uniref:Uncharacterized protein n=1 Tax=Salmonella enterica subsp. enterica serovar Bovismorbificans TaxID=58097 RepID=A0A655DYX6_SALET|nr:Uncharacterised protein [Salmonella enterica subsp. enterica serovar Bovismorbificans]